MSLKNYNRKQISCVTVNCLNVDGDLLSLFSVTAMGFLGFFKRFNGLQKFDASLRALPLGYVQSRGLSNSKLFHGGEETAVPVLIVGAGPVGLVLAILLTKLGISSPPVLVFLDDERNWDSYNVYILLICICSVIL